MSRNTYTYVCYKVDIKLFLGTKDPQNKITIPDHNHGHDNNSKIYNNVSLNHSTWVGLVALAWDLGECAPLKVSGSILSDANLGELI
jgi:hypothetical protein